MKMIANSVLPAMALGLASLLVPEPSARASSIITPQMRSTSPPAQTVFVTNRFTRVLTNVVEMTFPLTVYTYEFRTNYVDQFHTNLVNAYVTNWVQKTHTNLVTIDVPRTNWVVAYRTNLNTLNATNWNTVVVLKTNWITQTVTNVLQINLPTASAAVPAADPDSTAQGGRVIASEHGLQIKLRRTEKAPENGEVEVELSVVAAARAASFRVREWQLVRPDGTVLFFGQRRQFTADLAPGTYQVIVSARLGDAAPVSVNGAVTIAGDGSISQPIASISAIR